MQINVVVVVVVVTACNTSKVARVVPIFESGDQTLFTNYRPIFVLPCFSKFLGLFTIAFSGT